MQEDELRGLQNKLEQLRRKYDQYFLGMEKREPGFERERIERDIRKSKLVGALNSATRFKYKQFLARYRTLAERWDRVTRQMEDGTYRRGAVTQEERLAAKQADSALKRAEGIDPNTGKPTDGTDGAPADASADRKRLAGASLRAQQFLANKLAAKKQEGGDVRGLYDSYVAAKKQRGEDVSKLSLSRFASSVKKQRQRAKEKLGTDVELRLKVTDDKVSLVAKRTRK